MQKPSQIWKFFAVVLVLPFMVYGAVNWYQARYEKLPVLSPEGHAIENFRFQNQSGEMRSLENWEGKIVVAHYFFTHCPVICPKMVYQMKRVQAYAGIPNLYLTSLSVDPERDSVQRLAAYATKMGINGKNWDLLTGEKKALYKAARNSFMVTATDGDGGPEDFIHSERLVLIDKQKRIRGFYTGTDETEVNKLINDIKKLAKE